jgi:hypothetical protein
LVIDNRLTRKDADGVAVRRGLRAGPRADVQGAARPVLHHDRLAQRLLQFVRKRTGEDVAAASSAKRDDHANGPRRVILGGRSSAERQPNSAGPDD